MFKQLNNLNGNEVYMFLALFIFIAFFIGATVALIRMKKSHVNYMGNIPLESENNKNL